VHESWGRTVDQHRTAQRDAIAHAAWALAQERGPFAVTMSQVADAAGVSRPTLYKYFPDVESMLTAHHRKHVEAHLTELAAMVAGPGVPEERLERLVFAYAEICHHRARRGGADLNLLVHSPSEGNAAESRLVDLFARAIREVDADRDDVNPATLAAFAVRALGTAAEVPASQVAPVARLVLHALTGGAAPSVGHDSA
jgi:AcrR family transcriptional regulator